MLPLGSLVPSSFCIGCPLRWDLQWCVLIFLTNWQVSKSSHSLANFHNFSIPFINQYVIDPLVSGSKDPGFVYNNSFLTTKRMEDIGELLEFSLPYGFIVLVTGVSMFIVFFIVFLVQATCRCCRSSDLTSQTYRFSHPGQSVWEGSVRLVRFSLIVGCFFVALIAATGLFYTGQFYQHLADPLVRISQVGCWITLLTCRLWITTILLSPSCGMIFCRLLHSSASQFLRLWRMYWIDTWPKWRKPTTGFY